MFRTFLLRPSIAVVLVVALVPGAYGYRFKGQNGAVFRKMQVLIEGKRATKAGAFAELQTTSLRRVEH